jgi:hypothetical protein
VVSLKGLNPKQVSVWIAGVFTLKGKVSHAVADLLRSPSEPMCVVICYAFNNMNFEECGENKSCRYRVICQ